MNKREIIAYFDARAPEWDARMVRSDSKIAFILDAAGVRPGVSVLDVACGTGVLFGDYLARDAARVTGVTSRLKWHASPFPSCAIPAWRYCAATWRSLPFRAGTTAVWYTMRSPDFAHPARLLARLSACLSPRRAAHCGPWHEPCGAAPPPRGRGPRREPAHAGAGTPGRADAAVPCGGRRGLGYGKITSSRRGCGERRTQMFFPKGAGSRARAFFPFPQRACTLHRASPYNDMRAGGTCPALKCGAGPGVLPGCPGILSPLPSGDSAGPACRAMKENALWNKVLFS